MYNIKTHVYKFMNVLFIYLSVTLYSVNRNVHLDSNNYEDYSFLYIIRVRVLFVSLIGSLIR